MTTQEKNVPQKTARSKIQKSEIQKSIRRKLAVGWKVKVTRDILHESKCLLCTKGKNTRITELKKLLTTGTEDERHEVEAIITYLEGDQINDTTITISGSTVVYKRKGEANSEFDGICIFPNRTQNQVVLLEAKNTDAKPSFGKKCLKNKLKNLGLPYEYKDIIVFDHDAYYKMTV